MVALFCVYTMWWAPLEAQSRVVGAPRDKVIVLTFDDGPRPNILPSLLDFLKTEKAPAVFFTQCSQAEEYPELIRRAHREGHEIANHTYGHTLISEWLPKKGKQWILDDIERCAAVIEKLVGYRPRFFRPRSWVISERYPTGWKMDPERPLDTMCSESFPKNQIFKEELVCASYLYKGKRPAKGYFVQMLDDQKLPPNYRVLRDVNTLDYEFHLPFQKDRERAVVALAKHIRQNIRERERASITIHILAFHELPVSLEVLKILVPEWQKEGYQFQTLRWVRGSEIK